MRPRTTKYRRFFIILAAARIVSAASESASPVIYEVSLPDEARQEIRVQVDLRGIEERSSLYLYSRAAQLHTQDQTFEISCDGAPLRLDQRGAVAVPENCSILRWKSRLDLVGQDGLLVEQQSFLSTGGGWGLLSGPASLLRLSSAGQPPHLRIISGDGAILYRGALPPISRPPFFQPFGEWATGKAELEAIDIVYHVDDRAFLGGADPWPEHQAGINYFADVLQLAPGEQALHVVWVGRRDEENNINGAAGDRVLLVNYTRNGDHLTERDRIRALFVLLHEQFHQIDSGKGGGAAWVGESIATYYALKALRHQPGDSEFVREIWAEFVGDDRPVVHTFRDIERQLASGDGSNAFLFYSQGAAFWFQLDELISTKTGGSESLDDYIGEIRFERGDGSSIAAIQTLPEAVANEAIFLIKKYIG